MAVFPPDDPRKRPEPKDEDPEVVDSCAPTAWQVDSSWQSLDVPAPRSWQDAIRRQQARREAGVGLSRLARAVQPPLEGLERRTSPKLDIDLSVPASSVTPVADGPVDPAVNDAFAPLVAQRSMREGLNPVGQRWMSSLPEGCRPAVTAQRHPHIINKLAVLWAQPKAVETYMGELLISSRSERRGFAEEVLRELFGLQVLLPGADRIG